MRTRILIAFLGLIISISLFHSVPAQADLGAPTELKVFIYQPDFIYLKWTPSTPSNEFYAYRVYRNGELVATTYEHNFLDMEYDRDFEVAYWTVAIDKQGNESRPSNLVRDPRLYPLE